jgi:tRNA modification GTPase
MSNKKDKNILFILNKSDKIDNFDYNLDYKVSVGGHEYDCVFISVLENKNIDLLIKKLLNNIKNNNVKTFNSEIKYEDCIITRERHRELIETILNHLIKFRTSSQTVDICVEELREAVKCFGKLLGKIDVEEILDVLFKDFCIGK